MDTAAPGVQPIFRLRKEAVAWRQVGDEIAAFDIGHSTYLGVNRTAAVLWTALDGGATRQELLSIALRFFQVDADRAGDDIDALLVELAGRGLLDGPAPSERLRTSSD
jgi:hypothetical protein